MRECLYAPVFALVLGTASAYGTSRAAEVALSNPYENVEWKTFARYRADAATQAQIDFGAFATQRTPYPEPRPPTFPADTTWPWSGYGAPSPADLGMLGIEGAELTCTYHVNSFFSDYGIPPPCKGSDSVLNEELLEVARRGGLAVLDHPDTRQPPEWFARLYRPQPARRDENTKAAWPSGEIVERGPVFHYADADATLRYVRAEVIRHSDSGPVRLFVNPFGLGRK